MIDTVFGIKFTQAQTWDKVGFRLPVTIIKSPILTVTRIKTPSTDGYHALQVSFTKPSSKVKYLREIRLSQPTDQQLSATVPAAAVLQPGDLVNATGTSRGRGFSGVVKRWGFRGGPRTHGQSDRHRAPGSIGQGTDPGRVRKGKRMPGHFGAATICVRNLTVVKVDPQTQEIWLKGQVPGTKNSLIKLTKIGHNAKFAGLPS